MVSFRAALDAGLDGLETDVHLTADGHLVLHHDPTLPGGHAIATMALADVRSHVGSALGPAARPDRIVTLPALPLTATGKPDRRALAALL